MDLREIAMLVLGQLPSRLPIVVALAVALVLVLRTRGLATASRRLGGLGFGVLLASNVVGLIAWPILQQWVFTGAIPAAQVSIAFALLSVPLALLDAAGLVVLAFAIVRGAR